MLGSVQRLLVLIIAAAALGSCTAAMTSYCVYVGNRRLMSSWLAWYYFRPLNGAMLAVPFYLVLWFGTHSQDSIASSSSLGWIIGIAGLVGLYSKEALDKLHDVFTILIKTDADASRKDKLDRNSLPRITRVDPIEQDEESGVVRINVIGERFVAGSQVLRNGSLRKTTFSNANLLVAELLAEDVYQPREIEVQVVNPEPSGAESSFFTLPVNPAPSIDLLKPSHSVKLDARDCQSTGGLAKIIVTGEHFVPGSTVQCGREGADRETKYISDTELHAFLHKSDRTIAGPNRIRAWNPLPGGGASAWVQINTLPVIERLEIQQDGADTETVTVFMHGSNFIHPVRVWLGDYKVPEEPRRVVDNNRVEVTVDRKYVEKADSLGVRVCNPDPVGGIVELLPYPRPTITQFNPASAKVGESSVRLTITGTGFTKETVVMFDQRQLTPDKKTLTETSLTVDLGLQETATPHDYKLAVVNPKPGGGERSSTQPFKVV